MRNNIDIEPLNACLENAADEFKEYYGKAVAVTAQRFGSKRTLFNPIYVSDTCIADCPYCGFRKSNIFDRKTMKPEETIEEALFLKRKGVNCILLLAGDYKHSEYVEMLYRNIKAIKDHVNPEWLGIEVAALERDEYKMLKEAGATSVTLFQETYDRSRYAYLHQNSAYKSNFDFRYHAQERAIEAGFNEVGLGVLYGVGFWKNDTYAMAEHAMKLKTKYPNVKLRFSFPRLQISDGQSETCRSEEVSSSQLRRAIAGIRLTFPDSSLVLTGRESINFLCEQAAVVDILGYGGKTDVGGYTVNKGGKGQFQLDNKGKFESFVGAMRKERYELCLVS